MIFDTHTHYDDTNYDKDREELFLSLRQANIGRICNVGSTFNGAFSSVALSKTHDFIYAAVGIHPDEVYDFYLNPDDESSAFTREEMKALALKAEEAAKSDTLDINDGLDNPVFIRLQKLAMEKKVVAIGEIGLDYHGFDKYEVKPSKKLQQYWFKLQLELALKFGLPVVIHSRNSSLDTMEILKKAHDKGLKCADIHCFSYNQEIARTYLDMGFYLGFGGTLTYEGQKKLIKVLKHTPLDRILLETDCPYLTPDPVRKPGEVTINSSIYLNYVIQKMADIKGISAKEVEEKTWENANRFYGL